MGGDLLVGVSFGLAIGMLLLLSTVIALCLEARR